VGGVEKSYQKQIVIDVCVRVCITHFCYYYVKKKKTRMAQLMDKSMTLNVGH
jgi:diphthamide synthase (EF-2-diphthine--ammonia ligase)